MRAKSARVGPSIDSSSSHSSPSLLGVEAAAAPSRRGSSSANPRGRYNSSNNNSNNSELAIAQKNNGNQLKTPRIDCPTISVRPPTAKQSSRTINHHKQIQNDNRYNNNIDGELNGECQHDNNVNGCVDGDDVDYDEIDDDNDDGNDGDHDDDAISVSFGMLGMLATGLKTTPTKNKKVAKERRSNSVDGALRLYSKKTSKFRRTSENV